MRCLDNQIKLRTRKDEFNFLMAQRKPQAKIPVKLEGSLTPTTSPLSASLFKSVIINLERTQGIRRA